MRHEPDGRIVEAGARTRTIPLAIRRALHHRDRGCRFPGCGLPFGRGITSATGPTALPRRSQTAQCGGDGDLELAALEHRGDDEVAAGGVVDHVDQRAAAGFRGHRGVDARVAGGGDDHGEAAHVPPAEAAERAHPACHARHARVHAWFRALGQGFGRR
jgi:hypothetical protein